MTALMEQLKTLQIHDVIPLVEDMPTHAEEGDDDDEDEDAREALAQAAAQAVASSKGQSRSIFKEQKHQVCIPSQSSMHSTKAILTSLC